MKFRLSSEFGVFEEVREGAHNGVDLAMPKGTELRSVTDGVVERITDYGSQNIGTGVIIKADDGTRLIYGHMDRVDVEVGERLSVGEHLGLSGNTGHSTGPHLHFGAWKDGGYVDPSGYVDSLTALSGELEPSMMSILGGVDPLQFSGPLLKLAGDKAEAAVQERVIDFLITVGEVLSSMSYSITLIGGGLLIVLWLAGMRRAGRWFSILFVVNILITFLLGGADA